MRGSGRNAPVAFPAPLLCAVNVDRSRLGRCTSEASVATLSCLPGSAVMLAAWLINSVDWGHDATRLWLRSVSAAFAAATLVVGWVSEPEELEQWAARALVAALGSALQG